MAETRISQAISLQTKFLWNFEKVENQAEADDKEAVKQQMQNFVKELFVKPEVSVIGAARGPAGIFFIVLNLRSQKYVLTKFVKQKSLSELLWFFNYERTFIEKNPIFISIIKNSNVGLILESSIKYLYKGTSMKDVRLFLDILYQPTYLLWSFL